MRRLLAALAALALAAQPGAALAAFALEAPACCCARMPKGHQCQCPRCAHERQNESDRCSLGGCSEDDGPLLPPFPLRPFVVAAAAIESPLPRLPAPPGSPRAPPRAPSREVPTPPPLA